MIVGTAGHIDHGKTSLVRRLTGVETDRLKEERDRGISIELGFAYWPQPDGSIIGFIDVPGHDKLVHTMLAGASGIDLLLLVVAADDGIMPQTREHLEIARLLEVDRAIVALTKSDLVDAGRRDAVATEIANLLADTRFAGAPIVPVSSETGEGIAGLGQMLREESARAGRHPSDGRFRLAVDRCFTMVGAGTVVTGTVISGEVTVGDAVTISPSGIAARVRSIRAQNQPTERGRAGDRCALNLVGADVSKEAIGRGDMVVDPALHAPTARIDAELTLLASEKRGAGMWLPVRLHHAAADVGARIVLLGEEALMPGSTAMVQLVLDQPIAGAALDRFVLRDVSASRTIGGGRFIDLRAPTRHRRSPERLACLAAQALPDLRGALQELLETPPHWVDLGVFFRDRAVGAAQADAVTADLDLVVLAHGAIRLAMLPKVWTGFVRSVVETLNQHHHEMPDLAGMGLERLRLAVSPRLSAPVFRVALQRLTADREVVVQGAWVRRPDHEARLLPDDERLWGRVAPMIAGEERFRPPRVRDIAHALDVREENVRRLFKMLSRRGDVHEVAHDHFFLRTTVNEMVGIVAQLSADHEAGLSVAQFRDRVDNGRKVAIQILEFFDRHGVTIRRGDIRRINRQRLDLFGPIGEAAAQGGEASPVGRPDFKSGRGRQSVSGGFDSHSLPPNLQGG